MLLNHSDFWMAFNNAWATCDELGRWSRTRLSIISFVCVFKGLRETTMWSRWSCFVAGEGCCDKWGSPTPVYSVWKFLRKPPDATVNAQVLLLEIIVWVKHFARSILRETSLLMQLNECPNCGSRIRFYYQHVDLHIRSDCIRTNIFAPKDCIRLSNYLNFGSIIDNPILMA